jgi:hypothetical protein
MKVPYPKHPRDIQVRIIHQTVEDGLLSAIKTNAEVALSEKMNDYLLRLGYSSTHIMGIIAQLMTKTKVRVDFRNYTERLELVNPSDKLTSPEAMSLLEDYIAETSTREESSDTSKQTQKIIVQQPKFQNAQTKKLKFP